MLLSLLNEFSGRPAEKFGRLGETSSSSDPIEFRGRAFGPLVTAVSLVERCREVEPEDYYLTVDSLDPAIIAFAPVAGSKDPRWVHRKKRFTSFLSPAEFGSAIPAGDGKLANLFLRCRKYKLH